MSSGEGYFDLSATDHDALWAPLSERQPSRLRQQSVQLEEWFHSSRTTSVHEEAAKTRKQRILGFFKEHMSKRVIRRVLKCTIAYFLSTLFVLIKPVSHALGRAPYLSAMGTVFSHPGRSMGAQFDTTVMACTGIMLSIVYAMAGLAVPKPFASIFLFFSTLFTQLLRQICPRFFFFSLQFMIVQIFSLTALTNETMLPFAFGVPLLIGCGISFVVNLIIWPETAMDGLGRAFQDTAASCKETLMTITEQFLLDPSAEPIPQSTITESVERMRKNMAKVRGAYKEAKYEISYTRIRPQELRDVRKSFERVVKHLGALSGSLRTERQLFGYDHCDTAIRRKKRRTDHRHVLYMYVEQLRDPLIQLSSECSESLQYLTDCFSRTGLDKPAPPAVHLSQFDEDEKSRLNDLHLREELFLVFFFVFIMRQIAKEVASMTTIVAMLNQKRKKRRFYIPKITTLQVLRRWAASTGHQSTRDKGGYSHGALEHLLQDKVERRQSGSVLDLEANLTLRTRETSALSIQHRAPLMMRARYTLWTYLQLLKGYNFKFALKIAVAVTALCVPAFIPWEAAWFSSERCQWASVTVVAIMNPTSGGTLQASLWRVIGTAVGTLVGWAALETGKGSAYVLALFAVLLAGPFFFLHLGSTYNKVGLVVLISYVVVALVHYVQPDVDGDIATTVWKRTTMVIIGILVSMVLNSVVWPFVARHATRQSTSAIAKRLGDYYTFLVGTFLYHDLRIPPSPKDIKQSLKIESKIQDSIVAAGLLLELTDHEPRLKGPFPKAFYKEIIESCQTILDVLECMRISLIRMPVAVKRDITNKEVHVDRRDMIATIMLHFYAISSTLNTKIPLPIYLPSMRVARMRLIQHRRKTKGQWVKFRNISWYAMSSCSEEIVDELEHLTRLVSCIVGDAAFADSVKRLDIPPLH